MEIEAANGPDIAIPGNRPSTLSEVAVRVLSEPDPAVKIALTLSGAAAWRDGTVTRVGDAKPPDRPARPPRPELRLPRDMPKRRRAGSLAGRIALLHALAHIELNAIDLAWDIIARFAEHRALDEERGSAADSLPLPRAFFDDWVGVAADEARHHALLAERMAALGACYGDLPAHDGLWQASEATAHDIAARLAIVPMVLEARGLDVTPMMIVSLRAAGDDGSAEILQVIHDDEIGHVAAGRRWFDFVAARRGADPVIFWQNLVRTYFKGELKRPFNDQSRARADFPPEFYEPIARML